MAKAGAYAGNFVCCHRCAHSAAADENAAFSSALQHSTRNSFSIIRIIHWRSAVSPHIGQLMAAFLKMVDQRSLQRKAGMVRTDGDLHDFFGSSSRAAASTASGVNPNLFCSSLSGAEAPNVFMPILFPSRPTYCDQPNVDACSTEILAVTLCGNTLSRYSADCFSKISHEGMLTTRTLRPSALRVSYAETHRETSLPVAIRISSGFLSGASAKMYAPLATPAGEAYLLRSIVGNGWRESTNAAGSCLSCMMTRHASVTSLASAGRSVINPCIARSDASCSIG